MHSSAIYLLTLLSQSIIQVGNQPVTGHTCWLLDKRRADLLSTSLIRGNRSKQTDFERFIWSRWRPLLSDEWNGWNCVKADGDPQTEHFKRSPLNVAHAFLIQQWINASLGGSLLSQALIDNPWNPEATTKEINKAVYRGHNWSLFSAVEVPAGRLRLYDWKTVGDN